VASIAVKFSRLAFVASAFAWAGAAQASGWTASERLETPRAGLAATSTGDLIFVGGGAAAGDPSTAFDVFDAAKEAWRPLPALPKGLMSFAMTVSGTQVFISGGYAADAPGEPRKEVWAYDTNNAGWSKKASLPHARAAHAMIEVKGRIYVIGGNGPEGDKTLIYDPGEDKWTTGAAIPAPRRAMGVATDGKRIYAAGGIKSDGGVSSAFDAYDPAANTWMSLPALPTARGALTAAVIDGSVHVVGGATWRPLKTFATHDVFDIASKTWSKGAPMLNARQGMASGVAAGRWWVIGGGSGAGVFGVFTASDAVEAYEP
jgi:N-acetylneuraminic acid mutarotase